MTAIHRAALMRLDLVPADPESPVYAGLTIGAVLTHDRRQAVGLMFGPIRLTLDPETARLAAANLLESAAMAETAGALVGGVDPDDGDAILRALHAKGREQ